jgi:CRP-like cAMP-binding protein
MNMLDTGYEVIEFEGDDPQWVFELPGNPAFARIPPENLQQLFGRFSALSAIAGQVVLQQGEAGDYDYQIRCGTARVTRT